MLLRLARPTAFAWPWAGKQGARVEQPRAAASPPFMGLDRPDPSDTAFPWARAIQSPGLSLKWWEAWEGDPNQVRHDGMTPLLFAAWAGLAPLMAILSRKGACAQTRYGGKSIVELAIESRDMESVLVALALADNPTELSVRGTQMEELPCAMGMSDLIQNARQDESRRRHAYRLDHTLAPAAADRERTRL